MKRLLWLCVPVQVVVVAGLTCVLVPRSAWRRARGAER
jgi:uncharacterized protein YjeT (DUF2065 family)